MSRSIPSLGKKTSAELESKFADYEEGHPVKGRAPKTRDEFLMRKPKTAKEYEADLKRLLKQEHAIVESGKDRHLYLFLPRLLAKLRLNAVLRPDEPATAAPPVGPDGHVEDCLPEWPRRVPVSRATVDRWATHAPAAAERWHARNIKRRNS